MQYIKTQAAIITRETYPIAVACLSANFATIPYDAVAGRYLVINDVSVSTDPKTEATSLTIGNCWMEVDIFDEFYAAVDSDDASRFIEVTRIK